MDSLNGFLVFVQVAETRSFVAAGRLMGVSASAIGKSVARLAHDSGRYRIGALLCRSQASVRAARDFVGAGVALTSRACAAAGPAAKVTTAATAMKGAGLK